jgi:hypothetical protein
MTTEPEAPPPPPAPAVHHLAPPGFRHDPPPNIGAQVLAELDDLHRRCLAGVTGHPFDPGAALVELTAGGRIRFVGGNSSSAMLEADLVDAVVHAARAGYRLCLSRGDRENFPRNPCWLPAEHPGRCEHRGWWRWSLLYGYHGPSTVVCPRCTPHQHARVPRDCPHQ